MKNLVIGNTSQLSNYFPDSYEKISSRNLDFNYLKNNNWNSVYICFAEQRTFLSNNDNISNEFYDINCSLVKKVIENINSNRIVYYSTAELWNNCNGEISIETPYNFISNNYTMSKYNITMELKNKIKYPNVSIAYPFNFNSIFRKNGYLFSKIFDCLINKTKIIIGDTHYYRDIIHPKMVVDYSIYHDIIGKDFIIGSGRLIHINDLIKKLFNSMNMDYNTYVTEDLSYKSSYRNKMFYSNVYNEKYGIEELINMTVSELKGLNNDYRIN